MVKPIKADNASWKNAVSMVMKCAVKDFTVDQTVALTEIDECVVRQIIKDETVKRGVQEIKDKIKEEAFKEKIPIIKEIMGLSLYAILETMREVSEDPELRRTVLSSAKDITTMTQAATNLNNLLRLDLGQSTENILIKNHTIQETQGILQELKIKDPVFDYPELPEN